MLQMRMNKYVYHYFCPFLVHLPLDFYMPSVFKYKGTAVVAS